MTSIFGLDNKEAVRIQVKKCEGLLQPEYKKLCVDPQITSYEILRNLLAKAFAIKSDFTISYSAKDDKGQEIYLSMLSDWDLDAAFFGSSDPILKLKVDLKPFEDGLDDWDLINAEDNAQKQNSSASALFQSNLFGVSLENMSSQLNKTMSNVGKFMGIPGMKPSEPDPFQLSKKPMTDAEFHGFLNTVGHMIRPQEFRMSVYQGGVENSLRKVVWRHLLNVYPVDKTGQERFDYLKQKTSEYYRLRDEWRTLFLRNQSTEEIKFVTNMVKKDVLRTDRKHSFYAGADDNKNVTSLFNLLTTYALCHPDISYCQGMSDLASPILVVQNDEAHAYVCFCGLMKRLRPNFNLDGDCMTSLFQDLALLLQHHDPDFYGYLKEHKADDLFFCYRWLLLELKREFPFTDALLMLEIMWSSLMPSPPQLELELADPVYFSQGLGRVPVSPTFNSNIKAYMRLRSRRQHSDDNDFNSLPTSPVMKECLRQENSDGASAANSVEHATEVKSLNFIPTKMSAKDIKLNDLPTKKSIEHSRKAKSQSEFVANQVQNTQKHSNVNCDTLKTSQVKNGDGDSDVMPQFIENHYEAEVETVYGIPPLTVGENTLSQSPKRPDSLSVEPRGSEDQAVTPPVSKTALVIEDNGVVEKTMHISSCEEAENSLSNPSIGFVNVDEKLAPLPPPQVFGNGNPFLMFLCLALFSQNRDHIMKNRMDYNDMAMLFDKMVRKHNVRRVLHQAQSMYASYLKQQQKSQQDSPDDSVANKGVSV